MDITQKFNEENMNQIKRAAAEQERAAKDSAPIPVRIMPHFFLPLNVKNPAMLTRNANANMTS